MATGEGIKGHLNRDKTTGEPAGGWQNNRNAMEIMQQNILQYDTFRTGTNRVQ
jgi:hypothetical protein